MTATEPHQSAHGGGRVCKIPPGDLEEMLRGPAGSEPARGVYAI